MDIGETHKINTFTACIHRDHGKNECPLFISEQYKKCAWIFMFSKNKYFIMAKNAKNRGFLKETFF